MLQHKAFEPLLTEVKRGSIENLIIKDNSKIKLDI